MNLSHIPPHDLGVFINPLSNEEFEVVQHSSLLTASQVAKNPMLKGVVTPFDGVGYIFNEYRTRCGKVLLPLENTDLAEFEIAGSNIKIVKRDLASNCDADSSSISIF